MGNPFIPFPRCENIIIVGDAAAEYLGALRIYGRGLIGGDVPSWNFSIQWKSTLNAFRAF